MQIQQHKQNDFRASLRNRNYSTNTRPSILQPIEPSVIKIHKQLNAHHLMFDDGYEIDLSQSKIITEARPLKSSAT